MLDLFHCTQLVFCTPGVIPGLGQPLPFHPRPLDSEFIQTLTWRRPRLDNSILHFLIFLNIACYFGTLNFMVFPLLCRDSLCIIALGTNTPAISSLMTKLPAVMALQLPTKEAIFGLMIHPMTNHTTILQPFNLFSLHPLLILICCLYPWMSHKSCHHEHSFHLCYSIWHSFAPVPFILNGGEDSM